MLNATQQVGASVGTALLATLSVGAITAFIADAGPAAQDPQTAPVIGLQAQVEGYTTAFTWAAGLLLLGALVSGLLINASRTTCPPTARWPTSG